MSFIDVVFVKLLPAIGIVHYQHCCPVGQLSRSDYAFCPLIQGMLDVLFFNLDAWFRSKELRV